MMPKGVSTRDALSEGSRWTSDAGVGCFPNEREMRPARELIWMIPEGGLRGFEPPKKSGRPPKPTSTGKRATKKTASNGAPARRQKGGKN